MFDFKAEEAKLEKDVLTLVFRASSSKSYFWKFPPHFHQNHRDPYSLQDWKFLGGVEAAPLGLYALPEHSDACSGPSGPACLQRTGMQALDEMSERSEAKTEGMTVRAQYLSNDAVQGLRNMFAQQCVEEMSDASGGAEMIWNASEPAQTMPSRAAKPTPEQFDIYSSEGSQTDRDASHAPSEMNQSMVEESQEPLAASLEELPVSDLRGAFRGAFQRLENKAPSEVSSSYQDWEKPEIMVEETEQSS